MFQAGDRVRVHSILPMMEELVGDATVVGREEAIEKMRVEKGLTGKEWFPRDLVFVRMDKPIVGRFYFVHPMEALSAIKTQTRGERC